MYRCGGGPWEKQTQRFGGGKGRRAIGIAVEGGRGEGEGGEVRGERDERGWRDGGMGGGVMERSCVELSGRVAEL